MQQPALNLRVARPLRPAWTSQGSAALDLLSAARHLRQEPQQLLQLLGGSSTANEKPGHQPYGCESQRAPAPSSLCTCPAALHGR